ncbi:MAG: hypothetical protein N3E49_07185 [Bacteroidia bacterium]|nr:hypothetical protein [Bacteroidia bacterium]
MNFSGWMLWRHVSLLALSCFPSGVGFDCIRVGKLFMLLTPLVLAQGTLALPSEWELFAVDALHHIYGWDQEQRCLYKLWAPQYDSITRIGGAPGEEGFLGLTAIAPLGNQQLYVLDAEGQKIFLLGTNLQPLQQLTYVQLPKEVAEGYPVLLTVGRGGELYLLLRETQEIVKIDAFGRVLLRFGGKLYGPGSITNAIQLSADKDRVYVVDSAQRIILEYDNWGNFLFSTPFPQEGEKAYASSSGYAFWRGTVVEWQHKSMRQTYVAPEAIRAVWVQGKTLYWLGERRLGWFPLP